MNRFARIPAGVRQRLFLTLALPLALAIVLSSLRYGGEQRLAARARLAATADSLVAEGLARAPGRAGPAILASAGSRRLDASVYRLQDGELVRDTAAPPRFGDERLRGRPVEGLLLEGRTVPTRPLGGKLAVLAPVRAGPQGEITGALLLADARTAPSTLPTVPLAVGLLVLVSVLYAASSWVEGVRSGSRAGRLVALAGVFLPPLAFCAWLVAALPVAAGGGGYRVWTVAYFAAWAMLAALGLRQVGPAASRPPLAPPLP